MSFAVVSGTSPQSSHGLSPHANVYSIGISKTPSSLPRASVAGLPPPFSLSATNGNDLVDMLGSAPSATSAHAKRIGTDPAKFKTTICRNWEQTGMCSFRGCTFAHGVDDLRPPMRQGNAPSPLERGGVSPTLGPKISPNTSPSMHASAVHNGGNSSTTKLDTLIDQLIVEVAKDKDLSLVHQEASRTLEAMIRREQALRQGSSQQLEQQTKRLEGLLKKLSEKDKALGEAIHTAKDRSISSSTLSQASSLLDETSAVTQAAEGCLSEYGIFTADSTSRIHEDGGNDRESSDSKADSVPRSYAAAVAGHKAPMGLRPIGGSPTDSPRESQ